MKNLELSWQRTNWGSWWGRVRARVDPWQGVVGTWIRSTF